MRETNGVGYTFRFAIRSQSPQGVESVSSQADLARVRPGSSVARHNKERKVNSRLLTALRSRNMLTRTAALAAACIVSTGAAGAQSPAAPGSAAAGKVGVISIRQAIVTTAEGKLASAELQSQFASRQNEIENLNKQINDLQARLQADPVKAGTSTPAKPAAAKPAPSTSQPPASKP